MSEHGEPMGGFVGFIKSLGSLCAQFTPKSVIVVWESGGNQKRRDLSGGTYKSGRRAQGLNRYYEDDLPNTQENHSKQISLTVEALKCLPVQQIYVKDIEADDVIGYICSHRLPGDNVIIVSSDRDLYQLINSRVRQWSLNQKKLIDEQEVLQKFGVTPQNFCVARSFIGDSSDSIEGAHGVGFKTISKRFTELSGADQVTIDSIIERAKVLSESSNAEIYKTISQSKDLAHLNWKLMHLDVSRISSDQIKRIDYQLGTTAPDPNKMNLLRILSREGLRAVDIDTTYSNIKSVLY